LQIMDYLFDKRIKVPSGDLVSEVELMRLFTTIACLKIVNNLTMSIAYHRLLNKLES